MKPEPHFIWHLPRSIRTWVITALLLLNPSVSNATAPDHDYLTTALEITALPYTHQPSTHEATLEEGETALCADNIGASVWYKYTPKRAQTVIFDTRGTDYDTVLTLWQGNTLPLTAMTCDDDSPLLLTTQSLLKASLVAATAYYIGISGYHGETGQLKFQATPVATPTNDNLAQAIDIPTTELFYHYAQLTASTMPTTNTNESRCAIGPSVWYRYLATQTETVRFDTLGTEYDQTLSIWSGNPSSLTEMSCVSRPLNVADQDPYLTLQTIAGTTYYLQVTKNLTATDDNTVLMFNKSPPIDLVMTPPTTAPTINLCETAVLTVTTTGSPPLNYQWYQGESGDTQQPQLNAESFPTPPLNRTTTYWLRVANASGYLDSPTLTVNVTAAVNSIGFDREGNDSCTTSDFSGVITSASGLSNNPLTLTTADTATITMQLTVPKKSAGKAVELLIFADYQDSLGGPSYSFMRDGDNWVNWDQQWSTLTTAKQKFTLKNTTISLYEGALNTLLPGTTTVYVGYRANNGEIVYSRDPIELNLK